MTTARPVRLVLVRHGESEWNAAGILQGHGGPGLTARGHAQAAATARMLARDHPGLAALARSDLPRVVETAAPTEELAAVTVQADERLREIDVGSWSGLTRAQAAAADPERYGAWAGGRDVAPGGGETFAELRARVVEGLADVVAAVGSHGAESPAVVVFTHGGPIRVAVAAALGLPAGGHRSVKPVGNCAVSVLDVPGAGALAAGKAHLVAYNRVGHLAIQP
ncbi:MAG: histidine phosphatase family protein [Egibacteraceae bacterium]